MYQPKDIVTRFARSLMGRIRENKMNGIMIGLHEDTDRKLIGELSLVCDKVVDLSEGV